MMVWAVLFNLDSVVYDASDGFRRLPTPSYPIQKMNRIGRSWLSERTRDAQFMVWAVLAARIGQSKLFAGFLPLRHVRALFSRDVTSREPKKTAQKWQIGATTSVRRSWLRCGKLPQSSTFWHPNRMLSGTTSMPVERGHRHSQKIAKLARFPFAQHRQQLSEGAHAVSCHYVWSSPQSTNTRATLFPTAFGDGNHG